ncbi:hypothetical protein U1Q18_008340, partial [Sarracenia purpurea var. burkii]
ADNFRNPNSIIRNVIRKTKPWVEVVENYKASIGRDLGVGAEEGVVVVLVSGEKVVVEGSDTGEMEEGAAVTAGVMVGSGGGVGVVEASAGDVEAREEASEGRVPVDEGGEKVGSVLDVGTEGEDEEGKEDECEEMRPEDGARLSKNLRRRVRVEAGRWRWRWRVVVHGGYSRALYSVRIEKSMV